MSDRPLDSAPLPWESGLDEAFRIRRERGPMTRQVREAALREGGEAAWEALLATLTPPCRARFEEPIGYFEWVDSALALELHEAWARRLRGDLMAQRGEDAAREILGGAHRWMLRLATPTLVVQAFPRLYHFYYDGGRPSLERLEPGSAALGLQAWGYPEDWFRDGVRCWIQVALGLAGAMDVAVDYRPPEAGTCRHHYLARWSTPAGITR